MELGYDAVLLNTAVAQARRSGGAWPSAFAQAVEAGRQGFEAGLHGAARHGGAVDAADRQGGVLAEARSLLSDRRQRGAGSRAWCRSASGWCSCASRAWPEDGLRAEIRRAKAVCDCYRAHSWWSTTIGGSPSRRAASPSISGKSDLAAGRSRGDPAGRPAVRHQHP